MKIMDQVKAVQKTHRSAFNALLATGFIVGALITGALTSWLG